VPEVASSMPVSLATVGSTITSNKFLRRVDILQFAHRPVEDAHQHG
jgi:hypothetical protein